MTNYKIFFEIFGKKMMTEIEAESKYEAIEILKEKIKIHKIRTVDAQVEKLKNIFGM